MFSHKQEMKVYTNQQQTESLPCAHSILGTEHFILSTHLWDVNYFIPISGEKHDTEESTQGPPAPNPNIAEASTSEHGVKPAW